MHGSEAEPPQVEPFLVVQLRSGWRYDPDAMTFHLTESERGEPVDEQAVDLATELPEGSRLAPMIPQLSKASADDLSDWERALARYLHLFPGVGADLDELVERLLTWESVEKAYLPPRVALP